MKLREIFSDLLGDSDPDVEISILIPEEILAECSIALESVWQPASRSGWVYRVDPEDPRIPQMRHVHICKEKHKSAKNMQASWNENGTRHDKKSFNPSIGKQTFVRDLARDVLGVPGNVTLESLGNISAHVQEDITFSEDGGEAYLRVFAAKA